MKENNKHKLSLRKVLFFVCIGLILSSLTACGPSDEIAPVISKAELVSKTVTVSASDDVGVTGYLLTTDSTLPSKDAKWSNTAEFSLTDYGTYYVWAKDETGNISTSVEVVYESTLERLAKDYDHLAWIIAPDTAETKALKDKYGDLYPMIEPLTEQQIKDRWDYLVNYLVKETQKQVGTAYNGGLDFGNQVDEFHKEFKLFRSNYAKDIYNKTDLKLSKFSDYYYITSNGEYICKNPTTFTSIETRFGVGLDIIDKVPFEDMEWFVRDYMIEAYKTINMAQEKGMELTFYFDPLSQD